MWLIVYCVCLSVAVSMLLKVFSRFGVVLHQAVAMNYVAAGLLCWLLLSPKLNLPHSFAAINQPRWLLFLALGVLFPTIFIAMGRAVKTAGIVRADAAQRLSLFLPIVASFTLFGETLSQAKAIGVILAVMALFGLIYRPNNKTTKHSSNHAWLWLLSIWIGYGVIDILLKQVAKTGNAFPDTLLLAFILAGILMFLYVFVRDGGFKIASIFGGLLLGVLNFFNIYFYIKAHQAFANNAAMVFTAVNIGVMVLATLVGALFFNERLNRANFIGVVLACAAVWVLYHL